MIIKKNLSGIKCWLENGILVIDTEDRHEITIETLIIGENCDATRFEQHRQKRNSYIKKNEIKSHF